MRAPLVTLTGAFVLSFSLTAAHGAAVSVVVQPEELPSPFTQGLRDEAGGGSGITPYAQPASSDALMLLHDQFSAMRQELEMLRAMVEEQANEIRRLQRDSRDRYTDLDARISALYQDLDSGALQPGVAGTVMSPPDTALQQAVPEITQPAPPAAVAVTPPVQIPGSGDPLPDPGSMTEQQLYQHALDVLLQDSAYQRSIDEFEQYLMVYPDGRFVTNAHYWTGQALVNLSEFERARDSFSVIVNDYPDGRKIDDAMYSLGTVYHRLGNEARARELLQEVMARFPNTSAANLADIYLRSL